MNRFYCIIMVTATCQPSIKVGGQTVDGDLCKQEQIKGSAKTLSAAHTAYVYLISCLKYAT